MRISEELWPRRHQARDERKRNAHCNCAARRSAAFTIALSPPFHFLTEFLLSSSWRRCFSPCHSRRPITRDSTNKMFEQEFVSMCTQLLCFSPFFVRYPSTSDSVCLVYSMWNYLMHTVLESNDSSTVSAPFNVKSLSLGPHARTPTHTVTCVRCASAKMYCNLLNL